MQGAVTFCGLVAGGVDLNNYQLNAEYAMTELLPGASACTDPRLLVDGGGQHGRCAAERRGHRRSVHGGRPGPHRARRRAAQRDRLDHECRPRPRRTTTRARRSQEEQMLTSGQLPFIESGRYMISLAEGGDSGYNLGVDYGALIRESPYYAQIKALYKAAGLNLDADLATLDHHETYAPEGDSLARTQRHLGQHRPPPGPGARRAHRLRPARPGPVRGHLRRAGRPRRQTPPCCARRT